jgi:peptide/nickel transport system substrate-binding protein
LLEAGRADYLAAIPLDRASALNRQYGPRSAAARAGRQRYFSGPTPALHFFALNTRRPLFASKRMRQAVNFALDRRALAARLPIPEPGVPGRPTDQFIAPGMPAFRDAAIYPLGGPDLKTARRLAGSHQRARAVLYTCNYPACLEHGRVLRRNLAAIGLDVDVKTMPIDVMFKRLHRSGEPWDIGYWNWFSDTADPSDIIGSLFAGPEPYVGRFRDEALVRRVRGALSIDDTAARARAFARLDADLSRAAAAAPFATAVTTDFFSERIGCQVDQPLYGISLGALCPRR